jgi:hypothetical protein
MIHNALRQWYTWLDIAPPLLRQGAPNIHIQSTPQKTDGWTCGLHMLLINLTTIYQGRIPALNHTQLYAEILSRSHLKYVLTGELDTHVIRLVRDLTNQVHRSARNSHPRKKAHTKHTDTKTIHNTPTPALTHLPRKRTQTPTYTHSDPKPAHSQLSNTQHI